MPSRRCNLKCTLRLILSLHICKIIGKGIVFCVFDWFWRGGGQRFRSRQMAYQVRQILNRIDLQSINEECLICIGRRNVKLRKSPLPCRNRPRENAADQTAVPIEREFRREKVCTAASGTIP